MNKDNKTVQKQSTMSGEGIALSFVGIGLLWAYLMPSLFGTATPYVAAAFILLGFAGFMTEIQKRFKDGQFRWSNGGVGLVLGAIPGWLLYVSYTNLEGWIRSVVCLLLSIILLLALAAVIDFLISIFEYFVQRQDNITGRLTGILKFIALTASTVAAVYASLSQII